MWTVEPGIALGYSNAVNNFLVSEELFAGFKSHPHYNSIVGMARDWQAEEWYNNIRDNFPSIFNRLEEFKTNDTVGEPELWGSDSGPISPSTLRYLHTVCDIKTHFGSLNGKEVVEIGVGYGGLCYMLHTYYDLINYHLVDLDNVITLVRKYLDRIGMHKSISFNSGMQNIQTYSHNRRDEFRMHQDAIKYDLCISEFCLSEMDDAGIDYYYQRYLLNSENIYLLMNLHAEPRKSDFIKKVEKDFDVDVLDEFPVSEWPNYVIVGKKK
jgi:putative sugar O-methyltransferase